MTDLLALDFVRVKMGEFGEAEQVRKNRIKIRTRPDLVRGAVKAVQGLLECDRLITISTADNRGSLEVIYHFTGPHRTIISVAAEIPRDAPRMQTVSDLLLPAGIYERQIHDLFGIIFDGHPALTRIVLNEDWPPDEFPLRKDWSPDPATFYGGNKPGGG